MAFPKLKTKGVILKIQNSNIESNSSLKESHIASASHINNSQVHNKIKYRINQDYQKAFENYQEREPQKIKPKPFQKTQVFHLFQQLEDDLNNQVSNLSQPKKDQKLEGSTQLQNQFNIHLAFKKQEKEIKKCDYFYQEKIKFQNLFHENSFQSSTENEILNKSDQNIKQTLKRLEQINDLKFEPNYHHNLKKNQDLINKEVSKVIKTENNSYLNDGKHQLLPQLINFKANRSHSPKRVNEDQSQIDEQSKNISEQSQNLKQKQIYIQNKQDSYVIKKLKKQMIDYLDEIIENFVKDVQISQNDICGIHQAVIQLITRIFVLREISTTQLKNVIEAIDSLYFCKKSNPLIKIINQQIKNSKIQEASKVAYKDRDQFSEKIKSLYQISTSQSISQGEKLKQEINLKQLDDTFKQVESIKQNQQASKQQIMQTISEIFDQKSRNNTKSYENKCKNNLLEEEEENSKLEDYLGQQ